MLDFTRSFVTWTTPPKQPHPHYKYDGGFVGTLGDVYRVRMQLDATCEIVEERTGRRDEMFLFYPCRSEYTIATSNFFQIPSGEWRAVFSRTNRVPIARRPSGEQAETRRAPWREHFVDLAWDVRSHPNAVPLTTGRDVVAATLANALLNARITYRDAARGVAVTVEFPIRLMNVDLEHGLFQPCCGPVIVPDLNTWDGAGVDRVFLAEVAFSQFDYAEFILRREIEPATEEKAWYHLVRGRNRYELWPGAASPKGAPPTPRPNASVYSETWELPTSNVVLRVD
ncbi:MAG: hypothetical protein FJX76_25405 [Armatimonadetes bacterium]|nr:hypothetical protein [Armatimonadota bacterium]MBM4438598.1 hypothetical protein [Actinomycetota bacterium]